MIITNNYNLVDIIYLRLNNDSQCSFALSLQEPFNHVAGHKRRRPVQGKQFAVVAQRPRRSELKSVRNDRIFTLISRNRTHDSGDVWKP